ncbi:MAG: hypothetical protein JSR92_20195 [Proteobacteria bacterium]|nr:hypothetical protein [Pseudomonadota bacterium]
MNPSDILQTLENLAPEIAAIVAGIDPKIASSVATAEQTLAALIPLVSQFQALKAAKDGVDPALWAQIVASNIAADAAVAALPQG